MNLKNIAFYNDKYPYGGGEVVSLNLSSYFHNQGFNIYQFASHIDKELIFDLDYITFLELPENKTLANKSNIDFIINSINVNKIDLIIVQGVIAFPFKEVKEATQCKIIFCVHNKPLWEADTIKYLRPSEIKNPTLARKLEFIFLRKPQYLRTLKLEKRYINLYHNNITHIDKLVFLSNEYKDEFQNFLNTPGFGNKASLYTNKLAAILNPLIEKKVSPEIFNSKENIAIYVGRLTYGHKRVDRMLKIWQKVERQNNDWKLLIIGTGPELENLKKISKKLKLKNVSFEGYSSNMDDYYKIAKLICLTSNFEGLPMSLMEGQQYGVIPFSFDSYSGIKTITENGKSGFSIPSFKKEKYVNTITSVMNDIDLQKRISNNCIESSRRYNKDIIGTEWIKLFKSLI